MVDFCQLSLLAPINPKAFIKLMKRSSGQNSNSDDSDQSVHDDQSPSPLDDDSLSDYTNNSEEDDVQLQTHCSLIKAENFKEYFDKACALKNENKFNEALLIFKALLIQGAEIHGSETNINLAMVYFQLGNSILEKVEESSEVLQAEGRLKTGAEPETTEGDKQDENEPLVPAWENLEVARNIIQEYLETHQGLSQADRNIWVSRLANTHLRLGECLVWTNNFAESLEEFATALRLLESIQDSVNPRRIASLHFQKGTSHMYILTEESLNLALKHFTEGKKVLEAFLDKNRQIGPQTDALCKELQDIIVSFDHKIEEAKIELETRDQVASERKKIKEMMTNNPTESGFGKSEFNEAEQPVRKLGRFGKSNVDPQVSTVNIATAVQPPVTNNHVSGEIEKMTSPKRNSSSNETESEFRKRSPPPSVFELDRSTKRVMESRPSDNPPQEQKH